MDETTLLYPAIIINSDKFSG